VLGFGVGFRFQGSYELVGAVPDVTKFAPHETRPYLKLLEPKVNYAKQVDFWMERVVVQIWSRGLGNHDRWSVE